MTCLFTLAEMFLFFFPPFFSSREREAAEKKKKEEDNMRNAGEKSNENQVVRVRHTNT